MIRSLVSLLLLATLAGCSTAPASESPASPDATTALATPTVPSPSPSFRPSPIPGQPAIADPYWLNPGSTGNSTWKDKAGTLERTDTSQSWQILKGGTLDGSILINGSIIGLLDITTTEGRSGELSPIEEQYGRIIDTEGSTEFASPNPNWSYRTETRAGTTIYIREAASAEVLGNGLEAFAFWWLGPRSDSHSRWAELTVSELKELDPVLTALFGPAL